MISFASKFPKQRMISTIYICFANDYIFIYYFAQVTSLAISNFTVRYTLGYGVLPRNMWETDICAHEAKIRLERCEYVQNKQKRTKSKHFPHKNTKGPSSNIMNKSNEDTK